MEDVERYHDMVLMATGSAAAARKAKIKALEIYVDSRCNSGKVTK